MGLPSFNSSFVCHLHVHLELPKQGSEERRAANPSGDRPIIQSLRWSPREGDSNRDVVARASSASFKRVAPSAGLGMQACQQPTWRSGVDPVQAAGRLSLLRPARDLVSVNVGERHQNLLPSWGVLGVAFRDRRKLPTAFLKSKPGSSVGQKFQSPASTTDLLVGSVSASVRSHWTMVSISLCG